MNLQEVPIGTSAMFSDTPEGGVGKHEKSAVFPRKTALFSYSDPLEGVRIKKEGQRPSFFFDNRRLAKKFDTPYGGVIKIFFGNRSAIGTSATCRIPTQSRGGVSRRRGVQTSGRGYPTDIGYPSETLPRTPQPYPPWRGGTPPPEGGPKVAISGPQKVRGGVQKWSRNRGPEIVTFLTSKRCLKKCDFGTPKLGSKKCRIRGPNSTTFWTPSGTPNSGSRRGSKSGPGIGVPKSSLF